VLQAIRVRSVSVRNKLKIKLVPQSTRDGFSFKKPRELLDFEQ
jgi:hypothetical protein